MQLNTLPETPAQAMPALETTEGKQEDMLACALQTKKISFFRPGYAQAKNISFAQADAATPIVHILESFAVTVHWSLLVSFACVSKAFCLAGRITSNSELELVLADKLSFGFWFSMCLGAWVLSFRSFCCNFTIFEQ